LPAILSVARHLQPVGCRLEPAEAFGGYKRPGEIHILEVRQASKSVEALIARERRL